MAEHKVTFRPDNVTLPAGQIAKGEEPIADPNSLLNVALAGGVQIEHACGGAGVCGTCHVIVQQGAQNLSEPDDDEMDVVDAVPGNTLDSRLACRAVVKGDVTVSIPDWNRNAVSENRFAWNRV